MGTQQQFCLRWNNHQTNMLSVFDHLLQNETLVDVTLACEGVSLRAHKVVLSACSPYFQSLFVENPCKHPIVILRDIAFVELKALIDFMYKGEVNVSQDKLPNLLKTAEYLKVKGLSEVSHNQTNDSETVMTTASKQNILVPQVTNSPCIPSGSPPSKRKKRHRKASESISGGSDNEDSESLNLKGSPEVVEARVELPQNLGEETPQASQNTEDGTNAYPSSPMEAKDNVLPQSPHQEDDVSRIGDMPYSAQNPGIMVASLPSTSASQYNQDLLPPNRRTLAYAPQHCRLCHKVISNIYNFRKHMKVHSPVQQRFECYLCLRVYNREDNLRWHLKTKHGMQLHRKPRRSNSDGQSSQSPLVTPVTSSPMLQSVPMPNQQPQPPPPPLVPPPLPLPPAHSPVLMSALSPSSKSIP